MKDYYKILEKIQQYNKLCEEFELLLFKFIASDKSKKTGQKARQLTINMAKKSTEIKRLITYQQQDYRSDYT